MEVCLIEAGADYRHNAVTYLESYLQKLAIHADHIRVIRDQGSYTPAKIACHKILTFRIQLISIRQRCIRGPNSLIDWTLRVWSSLDHEMTPSASSGLQVRDVADEVADDPV